MALMCYYWPFLSLSFHSLHLFPLSRWHHNQIKEIVVGFRPKAPYQIEFELKFIMKQDEVLWISTNECAPNVVISDLVKGGISLYVTNIWHWAELVNIVSSLVAVTVLVLRSLEVVKATEYIKIHRGNGDFEQMTLCHYWGGDVTPPKLL